MSKLAFLFLLVVQVISCKTAPPDIKTLLQAGRLADLPASASELKLDGAGNMFSSSYFIVFRADPQEIDDFLNNSPSIKEVKPVGYSSEHQYLPKTEEPVNLVTEHEYFFLDDRWPWYNPAIRVRGRAFRIPQDSYAIGGLVIVNDETNTVYIRIQHS